jgi:hypothetical protein
MSTPTFFADSAAVTRAIPGRLDPRRVEQLARETLAGHFRILLVPAEPDLDPSGETRALVRHLGAGVGFRTLLCDCRFQAPSTDNSPGMADLLLNRASDDLRLIHSLDNEPGCYYLPPGLLDQTLPERTLRQAYAAILERWRGRFEIVVILADSPERSGHPRALGPSCDRTLLFAREHLTPMRSLHRTLGLLDSQTRAVGIYLARRPPLTWEDVRAFGRRLRARWQTLRTRRAASAPPAS